MDFRLGDPKSRPIVTPASAGPEDPVAHACRFPGAARRSKIWIPREVT